MQKQTFLTVASRGATGDEPSMLISNGATDRDADNVEPTGCQAANFMKNPVVLFGHDYTSLPVGVATAVDVSERGILTKWRWLEKDERAARVRNAWDQGVLRAASIGFIPIDSEPNGKGGRRFTKWELLEFSLVPVPCNPEAVRAMKRLRLWDDEDVLTLSDDRDDVLQLDDEDDVKRINRLWERDKATGWRPPPLQRWNDEHIDVTREEAVALIRSVAGEVLRELVVDPVADSSARGRNDLRASIANATQLALARSRGRID